MSELSLEQLASDESTVYNSPAGRLLARAIIVLRDRVECEGEWSVSFSQSLHDVKRRMTALEAAPQATTARLDSHNRVMQSIVRRVRALEGGGAQDSPFTTLSDRTIERNRELIAERDRHLNSLGVALVELSCMQSRAEQAERERDAARASVERLTAVLVKLDNLDAMTDASWGRKARAIITAALEDA